MRLPHLIVEIVTFLLGKYSDLFIGRWDLPLMYDLYVLLFHNKQDYQRGGHVMSYFVIKMDFIYFVIKLFFIRPIIRTATIT